MKGSDQSLILIGAARSGTKLLRDLIATHPVVVKVPYDINYIWRFGNESTPHDQLSPQQLSPEIKSKIVTKLDGFRGDKPWLVEKTVSNCLRVPFVQAVLPEAKFIHLVRDGRDVVESVYRQWIAPPDWSYIWQKARSFPLWDAFGYGLTYSQTLIKKLTTKEQKTAGTWGVRYPGIDSDLSQEDLLVVCAKQWDYCVQEAIATLQLLPPDQVITLRYEDLVRNPQTSLTTIAEFMAIDPSPYLQDWSQVDKTQVGKASRHLTPQQQELILPYLESSLILLNYM